MKPISAIFIYGMLPIILFLAVITAFVLNDFLLLFIFLLGTFIVLFMIGKIHQKELQNKVKKP